MSMEGDPAEPRVPQTADELIMSMSEKECRSALLMLAYATTSLTSDDDGDDGDEGLNATQAAIAEDATRTAIREVLMQTRGIAVPAPALEIRSRRLHPVKPVGSREQPAVPDTLA